MDSGARGEMGEESRDMLGDLTHIISIFQPSQERQRHIVLLLVVPFWNRGEVKLDEHEMGIVKICSNAVAIRYAREPNQAQFLSTSTENKAMKCFVLFCFVNRCFAAEVNKALTQQEACKDDTSSSSLPLFFSPLQHNSYQSSWKRIKINSGIYTMLTKWYLTDRRTMERCKRMNTRR